MVDSYFLHSCSNNIKAKCNVFGNSCIIFSIYWITILFLNNNLVNPIDNCCLWQGSLYASETDKLTLIQHGRDFSKYSLFLALIRIGDYSQFILLKKDEFNTIQVFSSPDFYQYGYVLISNYQIGINIHSSVGYSISSAIVSAIYALNNI